MSFPVTQGPGHSCNSIIHNIREEMEFKARGDRLFNIIMKIGVAAMVPLSFICFKIPAKIARNNGDEEKEREYSKLTTISFAVQAINMIAGYFIAGTSYFVPDCVKECTDSGSCGGYFDFFNSCGSCVNKCESNYDNNSFLKIALIYLPLSAAITGLIGKIAENTLVKLLNVINRPQIQKKINRALDTMGPGISSISILKSCQDIDGLSQPIENCFFKEINEDIFEDLWKYSDEHEREDLKQKCLEFLKSNGSNTVRAIKNAWEGELPAEIALLL